MPKKKIVALMLIAFCAISGFSFNGEQKMQNDALKVFSYSLDTLTRNSEIIKEFVDHKNKSIYYCIATEKTNVAYYESFFKRNKFWFYRPDKEITSFGLKCKYRLVKFDKSEFKSLRADPYDIKVVLFQPALEEDFYYVEARFFSIGEFEDYFEGRLYCKFNRKGTLLKYAVFEGVH